MSRGAQTQGKEWLACVRARTGPKALARLEPAGAPHEVAKSISEEQSMLLLSMAPTVFERGSLTP